MPHCIQCKTQKKKSVHTWRGCNRRPTEACVDHAECCVSPFHRSHHVPATAELGSGWNWHSHGHSPQCYELRPTPQSAPSNWFPSGRGTVWQLSADGSILYEVLKTSYQMCLQPYLNALKQGWTICTKVRHSTS